MYNKLRQIKITFRYLQLYTPIKVLILTTLLLMQPAIY